MPPRLWAYGVALYALNLELSLNISASLEGWYVDHLTWHWIFWQNVPLSLGMAACLHLGVRSQAPPPVRINQDVYGLLSCGLGLALIYAALDQGNRLDWTSSGLIWGLALAGITMLISFAIHEWMTPFPWLDYHVVFARPLPYLLLLVAPPAPDDFVDLLSDTVLSRRCARLPGAAGWRHADLDRGTATHHLPAGCLHPAPVRSQDHRIGRAMPCRAGLHERRLHA